MALADFVQRYFVLFQIFYTQFLHRAMRGRRPAKDRSNWRPSFVLLKLKLSILKTNYAQSTVHVLKRVDLSSRYRIFSLQYYILRFWLIWSHSNHCSFACFAARLCRALLLPAATDNLMSHSAALQCGYFRDPRSGNCVYINNVVTSHFFSAS